MAILFDLGLGLLAQWWSTCLMYEALGLSLGIAKTYLWLSSQH